MRSCFALLLAVGLHAMMTVAVQAASPSPGSGAGGDPRSAGQGPGLIGDPLTAIGLVLVIGLGSAVATFVYVRVTTRRDPG